MRKSYYSEKDFQETRIASLAIGLSVHFIVILALFFLHQNSITAQYIEEMLFGSSGGGGGPDETVTEFGPSSAPTGPSTEEWIYSHQFTLMDIHVYSDKEPATPVLKKEQKKPTKAVKKKKQQQTIVAENLPIGRVRRGTGPGSGGGTGGGSGGGIGKGQGYAIDWGGAGGRRLLSGRLPEYPKGTDKQMAVVLQFFVLPDGSVGRIIPVRKTDELLERSAISALQTWRFDPLPSQLEQKTQNGTISFKFKLE